MECVNMTPDAAKPQRARAAAQRPRPLIKIIKGVLAVSSQQVDPFEVSCSFS